MRAPFFVGIALLLPFLSGCSSGSNQPKKVVVVYSSVDKEVADPLVKQFHEETGIEVLLVCDTEKAKSSGLLNRLIEEKERPQCDVFLSEDPVRSAVLKKKGVSTPYQSPSASGLPKEFSDPDHHWTGMSARARVLLVNLEHPIFKTEPVPSSVHDLVDARYKGKACIGHPLFGTTTLHCLAIFHHLGEDKAKELFENMLKNEVRLLQSDGDVAERVEKGHFAFGLTDNDDALSVAPRGSKKMKMVFLDEKALGVLAPDAPVLIKNGPNPEHGKKFVDFILRPETEVALAKMACSQIPLRPELKPPEEHPPLHKLRGMKVDYNKLADLHDRLVQGYLKDWSDRMTTSTE